MHTTTENRKLDCHQFKLLSAIYNKKCYEKEINPRMLSFIELNMHILGFKS